MARRSRADDPPDDARSERVVRAVAGGLRAAIHAHGPITLEWIGSAVKRVVANLRTSDVLEELRPSRRGRKK